MHTSPPFDFSPNVVVSWEEDIKAVRLKWNSLYLSLDKFKTISEMTLGLVGKNKGTIWIADMFESEGALSSDIQKFVAEIQIGQAIAKGIKMVLIVAPQQIGLASLSTKKWSAEVDDTGSFITAKFPTFEACKAWILERQANA